MRLVVTLENADQAGNFSLFLIERGVENQLETKAENQHLIWVFDEDSISKAQDCYQEFCKHPNWSPSPALLKKRREEELQKQMDEYFEQNPDQFNEENMDQDPLQEEPELKQQSEQPQVQEKPATGSSKLTFAIAILCVVLFLWASLGAPKQVETPSGEVFQSSFLFSPPYSELLYESPLAYQYASSFLEQLRTSDNPQAFLQSEEAYKAIHEFQTTPYWHGFYETLFVPESTSYSLNKTFSTSPQFEQIAQGQVWRIFTPALLHANFFHILFNLIWFVFLGKQMEQRIGFLRYLFFILVAAAVTNTAQYLMSGPNFLGLSGVVMAQAGYIWMRQSVAAWEGYTIQKATLYFLAFYVLVLVGIQTASLIMELNGQKGIAPNIANTAHVTGALLGLFLGRLNMLSAWRLNKLKK